MANLTGIGIPKRETQAKLGDVYTDTNTGKRYECILSYKQPNDEYCQTHWRELTKYSGEGGGGNSSTHVVGYNENSKTVSINCD